MNEQNTTPAALAGAAGAQKEKREPEVKIPNSFHANKKMPRHSYGKSHGPLRSLPKKTAFTK